jgi:tetratricopeptide (TPR) repeat protein
MLFLIVAGLDAPSQTSTITSTTGNAGIMKIEAAETASAKTNAWEAATILQQTGDTDKLFSASTEMTTRWPQDARSWYYLGNAYYMKGQTEDARTAYKHSIELNPQLHNTWANLGTICSIAGDHEQAIADFKESLRLQSDYDIWLKLGLDQEAVKDFTGAVASFGEAATLQPTNQQNTTVWLVLGMSLYNQNRFDETISTMNQALKFMPKNEDIYGILISAYMKSGKFTEMMSAAMELAKINPTNEIAKSLSKMKEDQPFPSAIPTLTNETSTSGLESDTPKPESHYGYVTNADLLTPFTLTNSVGDVITNAELVKLTPNKFIYKTPTGVMGMLRLDSLSTELQLRFGYDAADAAAQDAIEADAKMRDLQWRQSQRDLAQQQDELKASRQSAVSDISGSIRANAEKEWPTDYEMQRYEIKKQTDAYNWVVTALSATGVPQAVFDQIKIKAANEWPDDYEMQKYEINKQVKAYTELH